MQFHSPIITKVLLLSDLGFPSTISCMKTWNLLHQDTPQTIDEVIKILLKNRGIENIDSFLNVKHPADLTLAEVGINQQQMKKAVKRIIKAQKTGEKVLIFGDYDADGICATAILWLTLHHLKINAWPFIPHRGKHGYGVSDAALDGILSEKEKPALIITVDNGIVAHKSLARLLEQEKIDVIVTDHHQPETDNDKPVFPPATAVVHTTQLCGATVSWLLSRELDKDLAMEQLDLAGIATIADQVSLIGANRSFAKFGLEALAKTEKIGLNQLFQAATIEKKNISSGTVGFSLVPRINAMGRLKHGLDALRLLCTNSHSQATNLVKILMETNIERQDLTNELLADAILQAEKQAKEHLIIVSSPNYHEGVIGLIAGRLMEKYHKPAIALSLDHNTAKASARSVPGVNITELLRQVQADLIDVGGHPLAAGFSVEVKKLPQVKQKLAEIALVEIPAELLQPTLDIELELPWELVGEELVAATEKLAPFGQDNPRPFFLLSHLKILNVMSMGKENNHLKMVVGQPEAANPATSTKTLNILAWRRGHLAKDLQEGQIVSLVGSLELNHWNGKTSVQMVLKELAVNQPFPPIDGN